MSGECRRHLSPGEIGERKGLRARKRAAVIAAVIENPGLSSRVVAAKVGEKIGEPVDHNLVLRARNQLVHSEEMNQLPERTTGKDGKSRPARRPPDPAQQEPPPPAPPPPPPPPPAPKPVDWFGLRKRTARPLAGQGPEFRDPYP